MCLHVPATSRRNYQEEGMMEFWGNSGTEGTGRESQGRSKAVRRSMHDLWSRILAENGITEGWNYGGWNYGKAELRKDGTTEKGGRLIAETTAKNLSGIQSRETAKKEAWRGEGLVRDYGRTGRKLHYGIIA